MKKKNTTNETVAHVIEGFLLGAVGLLAFAVFTALIEFLKG